jgi:hypothetical protein
MKTAPASKESPKTAKGKTIIRTKNEKMTFFIINPQSSFKI